MPFSVVCAEGILEHCSLYLRSVVLRLCLDFWLSVKWRGM